MHTLSHAFEKTVLSADGRYLNAQELYPLEQYVKGYTARLETYHLLRDNSEKLVLQALRQLAQVHPELIQQHGKRCKYDMSEVLRYISLSVLRDDETFFREAMMSWLDTILVAHRRQSQCMTAYQYLHDVLGKALPAASFTLVRPYLDIVLLTLKSHN